jgi:hypothetical protein
MGQQAELRTRAGLKMREKEGTHLPELGHLLSPQHHTVHSIQGQIRAAAAGRDKVLGQLEGSG